MDTQTTVALELDEMYEAGDITRRLLTCVATMQELVQNAGLYCGVNPVLSGSSTVDDVRWFNANVHRSHRIRDSNVDEYVTRGRETAAPFVVIRQVRPGARFICAIPDGSVLAEDAAGIEANWFEDDDVLFLLFEFLCRLPGKPFAPHKLIAKAAELKSGSLGSSSRAGGRLS